MKMTIDVDGSWIKEQWGEDENNVAHYIDSDEIDEVLDYWWGDSETVDEDTVYSEFRYGDADDFREVLRFDDAFEVSEIEDFVREVDSSLADAIEYFDLFYDVADGLKELCENRSMAYTGNQASDWLREKVDGDEIAVAAGYDNVADLMSAYAEDTEE